MYRTIRVRKDGEEIVAWRAHQASVFVRDGDLLYYADFSPHANGCRIVAYHLQAREESWKTPLLGIGSVSHSLYTNRVNMKLEGTHLIVYGDEAGGRYIEILDRSPAGPSAIFNEMAFARPPFALATQMATVRSD